jgi:hypothetical protein
MSTAKPVRFSEHARQQLRFRGATEQEVIDSIQTAKWEPAELGRLECRKSFTFEAKWNKKYYAVRQVRPIFVEKPDNILVVTVYVYYF